MKTRSSFEICLPLVVFGVACLASLPTLILSLLWLTLGACSVGHRSLEEFLLTESHDIGFAGPAA